MAHLSKAIKTLANIWILMSGSNTPRIDCALDAAMSVIEGRWKAPILCKLAMKGSMRFNQILRELDSISPRILAKQLKEMEQDGLISRLERPDVHMYVEYSITRKGLSLCPALRMLADWALDNMMMPMVRFDEGIEMPNVHKSKS